MTTVVSANLWFVGGRGQDIDLMFLVELSYMYILCTLTESFFIDPTVSKLRINPSFSKKWFKPEHKATC